MGLGPHMVYRGQWGHWRSTPSVSRGPCKARKALWLRRPRLIDRIVYSLDDISWILLTL